MKRRRRTVEEIRARLYPGREPDDSIIAWLAQFDRAGHGEQTAAIKSLLAEAIRRVQEPLSDRSQFDLQTIRDTVLGAVGEAIRQYGLGHVEQNTVDDPKQKKARALSTALLVSDNDEGEE